MPTLQRLQMAFVETLCAQRDAVHAALNKCARHFSGHGFWIRFHGPFCAGRKRQPSTDRVQNCAQYRRPQQRGCSTTNEHGVQRRVHPGRHGCQFRIGTCGVGLLTILGINKAIKVAVMALMETERNVNIRARKLRRDASKGLIHTHGVCVGRTLPGDGERGGHELQS